MKLPLVLAVSCAAALAQPSSPPASPAPGAADRIREILAFLASDERAGRDSPSPGLDAAAAFLVERVEAAGLKPGGDDGSFFHEYRVPGVEIDDAALGVVVHGPDGDIVLKSHADVRLWRPGRLGEEGPTEVLRVDTETAQALGRRIRGRKPVLIEVDPSSALWQACEQPRRTRLGGRRSGGPPSLLVRKGLLPEGDFTATLEVPEPKSVAVKLRNVVALLPGNGRADEIVLLSAHYDHVGVGLPRNGDAIYNGADDNGTGTTAVLTIAEALAARGQKLPRTVAFVWFSAEEKGLLGSKAFAERSPFPLRDIVVNVNIEMLGRPWQERTAWVTGRDLSDFEAIAQAALARAGIECERFPQQAMLFGASDNAAFARHGVVAHSISASSLHSDYHQPSDELDKIDLDNMAAVIAGLREVVVEFATRDGRPAYNDKGRKRLGLEPGK